MENIEKFQYKVHLWCLTDKSAPKSRRYVGHMVIPANVLHIGVSVPLCDVFSVGWFPLIHEDIHEHTWSFERKHGGDEVTFSIDTQCNLKPFEELEVLWKKWNSLRFYSWCKVDFITFHPNPLPSVPDPRSCIGSLSALRPVHDLW